MLTKSDYAEGQLEAEALWLNKWKIMRKLGEGGQGVTHLVSNVQTQETAVLKRQVEERRTDAEARRRMFQEVNNLRIVHSAGGRVPQVIDGNTAQYEGSDLLYFAMEYIDGETLEHVVGRKKMNLDEASAVAFDLIATLKIAHREGIQHRDIKPK